MEEDPVVARGSVMIATHGPSSLYLLSNDVVSQLGRCALRLRLQPDYDNELEKNKCMQKED